jgi:hypothetical protein
MQVPVTHAVNPAAEVAGSQQVRKNVDSKDQVTPKMMARALDPAKQSEQTTRAPRRRRGRGLDISA